MARKITAFGPTEHDVRSKIYNEASKYPYLTMGEIKIIGPAKTEGGGTQYVAECILT
ncbi:hypothetical protein [Paenibacillus rigui]|uniref:hypothetical protein n=1 Tax=Paenibacillus rigui TaxID=554312 RepID=UPI0015C68CC4|nr:hypothetical protein [Paenibacillus rigui]